MWRTTTIDDDNDEGEVDYGGEEGEDSDNEVVHTVKRIVATCCQGGK